MKKPHKNLKTFQLCQPMKTLVMIMSLALMTLFGSCGDFDTTEKKLNPKEQLAKLDTDKDNKISREEWLFSRKTDFSRFDVDKDGFIQKSEMKSTKIPGSGRRFLKIDVNADKQITMQEWLAPNEKRFDKRDRNLDGFITEAELKPRKSIKQRIAKFDTDKDGKISSDEWISSRKERFLKFDKDNDGFIQKDEMNPKNKPDSNSKFEKIDLNGDHQITMEEWLMPSQKQFKNKDSDQDGFITEAEWKATRVKKN